MKVRMFVEKISALKAGHDDYGYTVVDVPAVSLTEAQRNVLARCDMKPSGEYRNGCYQYPGPDADFYLDALRTNRPSGDWNGDTYAKLFDAAFTVTAETAVSLLDAIVAFDAAFAARQAEKAAAEKAALDAHVAEWRAKPLSERVEHDKYSSPGKAWLPSWDNDRFCRNILVSCEHIRKLPEYAEAKAEADRLNALDLAEAERNQQEKDRKEEEKKDRKATGKALLQYWAQGYGSEFLNERIDGGFDWQSLAEQEYANSVFDQLGLAWPKADVPDGYEYNKDDKHTTPTLEEIKALKVVRATIAAKELPVGASMIWVQYKPEEDENAYPDEDEELPDIQRTELILSVECPTGRAINREFLIEDKEVASV